jgi:hypothetical protein
MEHMKRIIHVLMLIAAGTAFYVFALPHIMNMYRGDNVEIQKTSNGGNGQCSNGICPE